MKFTTPVASSLVTVHGSLRMYSEEIVKLSIPVVIDRSPQEIASPPAEKYATRQELVESLTDENLFGHCRQDLGVLAMDTLNLARKLYHLQKQSPESELLQQLTDFNYDHARNAWELFYFSCNAESTDAATRGVRAARREWYKRIEEESKPRFELFFEQYSQFRAESMAEEQ